MKFLALVILLCFLATSAGFRRRRRRRAPAPVNGGWSGWSAWSACNCDHNTGTGSRYRTRSCTSPAPAYGGAGCSGSTVEYGSCDNLCCLRTNGGFTEWGAWARCICEHSSGTGRTTRTRACTNPSPSCGGVGCSGSVLAEDSCDDQCCQTVHGGWGEWATWQCSCNHDAGTGVQTKSRECNSPAPSCFGRECVGEPTETGISCDGECCLTVDGGWGGWGEFGTCLCDHVTGTGERRRMRNCTDPVPECFGAMCPGSGEESEGCDEECCMTVDGGWTEWTEWESCTCDHTNGTGTQRRARSCTAPKPSCYGESCAGEAKQVKSCDEECCKKVDGGWTEWSGWQECECDHTVGRGEKRRERNCTQPEPACYGAECEGVTVEVGKCDEDCCTTLHGEWMEWSGWGRCGCEVAGGSIHGEQERTRSCTEPLCYGETCVGAGTRQRNCTDTCTGCGAGSFYNVTTGACETCGVDEYSTGGGIACEECEGERTSGEGATECVYEDPCYEEGRTVEGEGSPLTTLYQVSLPSECLEECLGTENCTRFVLANHTCYLYPTTTTTTTAATPSLTVSLECLDGCEEAELVYDRASGVCIECTPGMECYVTEMPPFGGRGDDGDSQGRGSDKDSDGDSQGREGDEKIKCRGIHCVHPAAIGSGLIALALVALIGFLIYRRISTAPPPPPPSSPPPETVPLPPGTVMNRLYGQSNDGWEGEALVGSKLDDDEEHPYFEPEEGNIYETL